LGYYTLAYNLIIKPSSMINPVITKVAFPVFSLIQNESEKLRRGYLKVLQLLATVNFPIMVGLAVVAPVAVPVIFGKQWLPSIPLVQVLTVVGLLRSTGNPVGALILAKGRADLGFKWNLGLTVTQIPGLYLGAKLGGSLGVAIAFSILMAMYSIFNYLILIRTLIGSCLRDYVMSMWPALWMGGVMWVAVFTFGILFQTAPQFILLIIQVLAGAAIYLGLILLLQKPLVAEVRNMAMSRRTL
jgi:O-antigen/teichoic acid export membrane protein